MLENIFIVISLASITYTVYSLIMRPFNLKYQRALDHILGKEIARSLYQTVHPEFTYDGKYVPDDRQSQLILSSAMEEYARISQSKQGGVQ